MSILDAALFLAALIGHFSICVATCNRLHALDLPKFLQKGGKLLLLVALLAGWATLSLSFWIHGRVAMVPESMQFAPLATNALIVTTLLAFFVAIPHWFVPRLLAAKPKELLSNDTHIVNVVERLGYIPTETSRGRRYARIPGNELFQLSIHEKQLMVRGLPPSLDGASIVHLSDLHLIGDLGESFYHVVVEEANRLAGDWLAITGDIVEKEKCLQWITPIFSKLTARQGKFFVLGNHDKRLKEPALARVRLVESGLTDLGGKFQMANLRDQQVLIAGNERPWFGGPNDNELAAALTEKPTLRIALCHSPDQIAWARRYGFELMLAGHTHGGQIRFPWAGPLIAPSLYGAKYASGLFYVSPTLMHVSRGVSGQHPIRWNCRPEITKLTLRANA